jgi:Mce-associated membrane protein
MPTNRTDAPETIERDIATADAAEPKVDEPSDSQVEDVPDVVKPTRRQRSVSVSVRGLVIGAVTVALVAAVAIL